MKKVLLVLTLSGTTLFAGTNGFSINTEVKSDFVQDEQVENQVLPIYYDTASAGLNAKAKQIIDQHIYSKLIADPKIKVEISSHTDYRGDDEMNQNLSERRAHAVVDYLVSKGISKERLTAIGYGETKPVNHCISVSAQCSASELKKNRRTEFKFIEN